MTDKDFQEALALHRKLENRAFWQDIVFGISIACLAILIIWGFV